MTTITRNNILAKVGINCSQAKTGAEALVTSKLNWNVSARNLFFTSNETIPSHVAEIPTHRAFVRDDNEGVLGVLTKDFTPVQNEKVLAFFDPFLESGDAMMEFAGSLRGGKTVWAVAKLNNAPIVIKGDDTVSKYLMAVNSHDGTMAMRVQFLPFRPACSNILARASGLGNMVRLFHSAKVNENLDQVQRIVNAANATFEATAKQYQELSRHDVDQKSLKKFVKIVFEPHNVDEQRKELALKKAEEIIQRLFETGAGNDLEGAKGTYWGLYNAATEYLTHEKGRTEDSRMFSCIAGDSVKLNQKALDTALEMALSRR
jgi:phage/plasmid-like protein (TIGR03299 family)